MRGVTATAGSNPALSATLRPVGFGWQATRSPKGVGCLPKLRRSAGRVVSIWYVYFLELKNGDHYVGSTNDLRRRFASHQKGQVTSTRQYLPLSLQSYVAVADEPTARALERYFKSGSGKAFAKKRFLRSGTSAIPTQP